MKQTRIENILMCLQAGQLDTGWAAFLETYSAVLHNIIRRFETDSSTAAECFEYVCAKLSDDDFRRLQIKPIP